MKKLYIVLSLVLITFFNLSCERDRDFTDGSVKFISSNKVPIVQGEVNGQKVFWIIDTGASYSILDVSLSNTLDFKLEVSSSQDEIAGVGGVVFPQSTSQVRAKLGGVELDITFKAQDLSAVRRAIQNTTGINIAGVLGSDWMTRNDIIVDYKYQEIRRSL